MPRSPAQNLFSHSDYKACLRALLSSGDGDRGQRSALSRAIGCQPAYLSRVLNGDAELSLEQMEAACRYFVLSESESHFLLALLGENRAGTAALKTYWREQIRAARRAHEELQTRLGLRDSLTEAETLVYYGSWIHSAVHIATSIPSLQTVPALSSYLSLAPNAVREALEFLVRTGLVEKKQQRYVTSERDIHLARSAAMVAKHHANWKLKSLESMNDPTANALRYTGVVSLAKADVEKIKEIVLRATERTRAVVRDSKEEILGCYSFEFFQVGEEKRLQ